MQVIIGTDHVGENYIRRLENKFPSVDFLDCINKSTIPEEFLMSEVYFGWPTSQQFLSLKKLKWIACPGMGIDKIIKSDEILNSDVMITNSPGTHVNPMADYTIGVMISLAHRFLMCYEDQKLKFWSTEKYSSKIEELSGKTLGIFGFGEIGKAIARRAKSFDMEIIVLDPNPKNIPNYVRNVLSSNQLNQLCEVSDYLVVAAPIMESTHNCIGEKQLRLMKEGSFIVIVSRGGIVDEIALENNLKSGKLGGAAIDATVLEPLPQNSGLWDLDNIIITPHVSALSPELYERRRVIFEENLSRYILGEGLKFLCDKNLLY